MHGEIESKRFYSLLDKKTLLIVIGPCHQKAWLKQTTQ
jgi:hypothetical protein